MNGVLLILCLFVSAHAAGYARLPENSFLFGGQEVVSDRIKGMRVYGALQAGFPVVIQDSTSVTIEFDIDEDRPANVVLTWYHCDRNWNKTTTSFINDDTRNVTRTPLPYTPAPAGTRHYRWHYTVQLPGIPELRAFVYSGNYQFELWDERQEVLLARGRFFVVERTLRPTVRVLNRQIPSLEHPWNKAHKVEVQLVIPERLTRPAAPDNSGGFQPSSNRDEIFMPILINAVDVYKNRELTRPYRIDANRPSPATFVYGFGTRRIRFVVDNIQPGNEYRRLDLRNVGEYPPDQQLRSTLGADVSRMQFRAARDNNGMALLTQGNRYADYLTFRFEFIDDARGSGDSICVVGEFNGWMASPASMMQYDRSAKRFFWTTSLRRGDYDYQYVFMRDGGQDWIALEGNDWRTVNVYTALVYYRDERYGGFDRILGVVQGRSSGLNEAME